MNDEHKGNCFIKLKEMNAYLSTKEDYLELKGMLQDIQTLLKAKQKENYEWTDATGMKQMLNCSDGALSAYRIQGILPYVKHGGKYLYPKKIVNEILIQKMNSPLN